MSSCRPRIQGPHEPIGIAPLGLTLHDEGLGTDGELIARAWTRDLARPYLEGCGLGADAGLAEAADRVGTTRPGTLSSGPLALDQHPIGTTVRREFTG
jgi:hypothetical protein